jgi:5-methylcytosine-specific restriction enzyme A
MRSEHRSWYDTYAWKQRRRRHLLAEPLCRMCLAQGKVTPAVHVDHVDPVRGDFNTFILSPLQSLCFPCHNTHKRRQEMVGFRPDVDEAGWPTDPAHPTNKAPARTPSKNTQ